MNCADIDILICEYVDGTLTPGRRAEVEAHLLGCPACAQLARDSAAAVAFMERAAEVEPPPELITRILFDAPWSKGKAKPQGARRWIAAIFSPILQPRFAMGMAMTILSLSMLANFLKPAREWRMADLKPSQVLMGFEQRAYRTWTRTVKYYDNLKFVYQIQTTLREWQQQNEEQQSGPERDAPARTTDEKKLPVRPAPGQSATPGTEPAPNASGGSK